jgi:cyclophilin family peptidyl-prolyl cis-trans isomerase
LKSHNKNDADNGRCSSCQLDRRTALSIASASIFAASLFNPIHAFAADSDKPLAPITHKVYFDVRISRSDGTFYERDDLPDIQENKVFYGKLKFGLFGKTVPTAVERFLSYVDVPYSPLDDDPLPSYGRSSFKTLDQSTGLLVGGFIPGLDITSIGGGTAIQFGGRILPAPLWLDKNTEKVSHSQKGLLSHRFLDATPVFGITTRACPELDASSLVFGQVLVDESSKAFFDKVQDLPTYSMERPMGDPRTSNKGVEDVAASIFNSQREFFRGAAKTLGDSRADKVYEGKLLRRVEVTKVGMI